MKLQSPQREVYHTKRTYSYVCTVDVAEKYRGFGVATRMLLFAEKLVPYNEAYIKLQTQVKNTGMQKAALKAGYFYLYPEHKKVDFENPECWIEMAKPVSPYLHNLSELRGIAKKMQPNSTPDAKRI